MRPLHERMRDLPREGRVEWLGLRPAFGAPIVVVEAVVAIAQRGLAGDRTAAGGTSGKRQVTLVQHEHLPVIAALAGRDSAPPEALRRNVVVSGLNLVALKRLRFALGSEVILEGTGPCEPCGRLDETLGPGGFQATRGHGGITARVLRGGTVRVGDGVRVLAEAEPHA